MTDSTSVSTVWSSTSFARFLEEITPLYPLQRSSVSFCFEMVFVIRVNKRKLSFKTLDRDAAAVALTLGSAFDSLFSISVSVSCSPKNSNLSSEKVSSNSLTQACLLVGDCSTNNFSSLGSRLYFEANLKSLSHGW